MKLDPGCVTASTAAATKTGKHDHRCFRGWEPGAPLRTQEQPHPDTALFQGSLQRQPAPCTPRKAKRAIPLEKPTSQGHPQARPVTGVPLRGRRETQQMRRRKEGGKEKCGGAHKKPPSGLSRPPPLLPQRWDLQGPERQPLSGCSGMRRNVCVKREVFGAWGGRRPNSFSSEGFPFSSQANLPSSSVPWQRGEETVNVVVRSTGCGQATLASQARMPLKNLGVHAVCAVMSASLRPHEL